MEEAVDAIFFVGGAICGGLGVGYVARGGLRWWERRAAVEVDRRVAAESALAEWAARARVAEDRLGIFNRDDFEG